MTRAQDPLACEMPLHLTEAPTDSYIRGDRFEYRVPSLLLGAMQMNSSIDMSLRCGISSFGSEESLSASAKLLAFGLCEASSLAAPARRHRCDIIGRRRNSPDIQHSQAVI